MRQSVCFPFPSSTIESQSQNPCLSTKTTSVFFKVNKPRLLSPLLSAPVRRVPPRFSIPPADSEIMPGGNVNITCVAVGSPMPYVKWMLGAEDLTPEDDMPIGRNVLELTDVRQSNNYTCVAMSTLGVIEAVAQIIVKGGLISTSRTISRHLRSVGFFKKSPYLSPTSSAEGPWYSCGDGENGNKHHSYLGFWQPRTRVLLYHTGAPMTRIRMYGRHLHILYSSGPQPPQVVDR